ncbi:sensor domain-containing diguanylate cyclase [Vibrio sp. S9_S30]|uniref:sensor domain-containing diguanylate cyclase n=1 Tax=Vibrio sp. S9_S30 TaxID=2720226 RepID=UPI00168114E4|nr:sensor domain-containing diguanylate cyclase [Vibrio sp. S9_S30]MBD1558699.1 sensor domain-containing diguanylate cyclase [Vibrio sp. S9_S30]
MFDSTYGVVIQRDFKALYVDIAFANIYGFGSVDEIYQLDSLLDLIAPSDHKEAIKTYRKILSQQQRPRMHSSINVDRNGREFSVLAIDHVIEWEGKPALQVTIIDMSAQEAAMIQLRENERRYRELVEGSLQGLLVHRDFKPLLANQMYAKMLGYKNVDSFMLAGSVFNHIPKNYQEVALSRYQMLLDGKSTSQNVTVRSTRVDGSTAYFKLSERLIDWDGQPAVQVSVLDVTEQLFLEEKLTYQANHDSLTGLHNRRFMTSTLENRYALNQSISCILIDLDDFKAINDKYGHAGGDKTLKAFARVLNDILGDQAFSARWGGEEFIVCMSDHKYEQALCYAQAIKSKINKWGFKEATTASFGVASSCQEDPNYNAMIQRADRALYEAKRLGKNCIVTTDKDFYS